MDEGKAILQQEKRGIKAQQVDIQFLGNGVHFNVIASKDETDKKSGILKFKEGDVKYYGILIGKEPHQKDVCTCESFYFGNSDEYKKSHPEAYQCKHLIKAREMRFEAYPS